MIGESATIRLMTYRRRRTAPSLANQYFALGAAVPPVMLHRLTRMWLAGPNPSGRDRMEFQRMYTEKVAAFYQSWNAMFLEMMRANMRLAFSPLWWPRPGPVSGRRVKGLATNARQTALSVMGAGLAPVQRRATANARRLRRVRMR